jgi:two-component system, response regulator
MLDIVDVLIVTDDGQASRIIRNSFDSLRHPVITAVSDNVDDALDHLRGAGVYAGRFNQDRPRAVLLDLEMLGGKGLELLKQIKSDELTRSIPVIAITRNKDGGSMSAAYDLGVNSVVLCPADEQDFQEHARLIAVYWLNLNQPLG